MTVLLLTGKPVDWFNPPHANTKVMWSQRTTDGKIVYGTFRDIAWLDRTNYLCKKRFGRGFIVYQGAYNSTIAKSAGTHDKQSVYDLWIPGVPGGTQQSFFRWQGSGAFYRTRAQGFMPHIHLFILPPNSNSNVSKRWLASGLKVGYLVDGGWSTAGRSYSSSQIYDYYHRKNALASHATDNSPRPSDIDATIFSLHEYTYRKRAALRAKAA